MSKADSWDPKIRGAGCAMLFESARRSILIADHRVTDPEMLALLERLESPGVMVRVLGKGAIAGLKSHGKAMVIDGKLGILGSISLSTTEPGHETRTGGLL